jgi:EAL domain-containing protein (putative c-di-GMP-specific phosphodiesterase class I)
MSDRDPAPNPPDPSAPATGSPPDSLPGWARAAEATTPAAPGARWLAAARRWWGTALEDPPATSTEAPAPAPAAAAGPAPARDESASPRPQPPAAAPRPAIEAPAPLQERLRRAVAHALRHPGYGFALLRVQIDWAPAAAPRARGADVGRQAERRLQLALRPGDVLTPLATPGAFAAVLDGVAAEADLRAIVQRLRSELGEPYLDGQEPVRAPWRLAAVHCAPGQPPRPPETLLQRAERALADAEPGGWVLAAPPESRPDARRLQQALAGSGLQLGFEPQVDFARAAVTALGVRLALREAPGRAVTPDEAGDDDALAAALLQRQLALAAGPFVRWRAADPARQACRLALPVAAPLVRRAGWGDELGLLLQDAGLDGTDVQLELPPTLPLQDRNLPPRLQALARQRLSLALDDFGTGQSSLSALGRLPLALLKIDRGFVPQAHELEHHRVLLESTVRLAGQLGIATLGKGLQTTPQLALLRGLGCQRGEGLAATALLSPGTLDGLPRWDAAA